MWGTHHNREYQCPYIAGENPRMPHEISLLWIDVMTEVRRVTVPHSLFYVLG